MHGEIRRDGRRDTPRCTGICTGDRAFDGEIEQGRDHRIVPWGVKVKGAKVKGKAGASDHRIVPWGVKLKGGKVKGEAGGSEARSGEG